MTQAEAASHIGTGHRNYCDWERKIAQPRRFWAERLSEFCKVITETREQNKSRKARQ